MPLDVPARESGLPYQFRDDAAAPMKAAMVVSAHVSIVLAQPNVLEPLPPSPLKSATQAVLGARSFLPSSTSFPQTWHLIVVLIVVQNQMLMEGAIKDALA